MKVDLGSYEFRRDPHPTFEELREHAPVFWDHDSESWYVTRFDDVDALLLDERLRSRHPEPTRHDGTAAVPFDDVEDYFNHWPVYDHSTEHQEVRKAALSTLGAGPIRAIAPRIEEWTRRVVSDARPGSTDLVVDVARPLAHRCLGALLGVSPAEAASLTEMDVLVGLEDRLLDYTTQRDEAVLATSRKGAAHLDTYVMEALLPDGTGLAVSPFVPVAQSGRVNRKRIVGLLSEVLFGTVEPTTTAIARALHELAHAPALRDSLARGEITPAEVAEEALRYDASFHMAHRVAIEPIEVGQQHLGRGERIKLVLASANRDPRRWDRPDQFDPSRVHHRHLTFGRGRHACLGASLVRTQTELAIAAVATEPWLEEFAAQPLDPLPMIGTTRFRHRRARTRPR